MKGHHPELPSDPAYFPVIGHLLQSLQMPAAVCLRSSFGFLFLRPKSILLSFSVTFTLLFIVAWNEPAVWNEYSAVCTFAFAVSALYVSYLVAAFWQQNRGSAEHDLYSGRSHVLRILMAVGIPYSASLEINLKQWFEPAVFLTAAFFVREGIFRNWLLLLAACLWGNEFRAYWVHLRKKKRFHDLRSDTEEDAGDLFQHPEPEAPKGTRKPKRQHPRNSTG